MTINWTISQSEGVGNLTVFLPSGEMLTFSSQGRGFDDAKALVLAITGNESDEEIDTLSEELQEISTVAKSVGVKLRKLSERIAINGSVVTFDGDPVRGAIVDFILKAVDDEKSAGSEVEPDEKVEPWEPLVNFLEKLYQNPSENSIDVLFDYLNTHGLTITPDGDFISFRGLRDDYKSIHSGPGIVNGVSYENANLDNSPGNLVEIARSYVNPDTFVYCGTGLHTGTYSYAKNWSEGKLVAVKVNPRDVVSVPNDGYEKIRVCRYTVLHDIPFEYNPIADRIVYNDGSDCDDEGNGENDDFFSDCDGCGYDEEDCVCCETCGYLVCEDENHDDPDLESDEGEDDEPECGNA